MSFFLRPSSLPLGVAGDGEGGGGGVEVGVVWEVLGVVSEGASFGGVVGTVVAAVSFLSEVGVPSVPSDI